jgi:hypothetical protein
MREAERPPSIELAYNESRGGADSGNKPAVAFLNASAEATSAQKKRVGRGIKYADPLWLTRRKTRLGQEDSTLGVNQSASLDVSRIAAIIPAWHGAMPRKLGANREH